jgi:tRNA U34 5-carboxymethylaminomethyl modifying GTPase MnmE/TrmE
MDRISKDFTALDGGDPFGVSDVRTVVQELTEAFNDLTMSLRKPNIMLIGKTGAGKSSLVNAVFGVKFADTGTGEPVTKHLARYAPEGKSVIVYDTKGLEHGNHEQFINDTEGFLSSLRASSDLRDHLHVIWYVLDMAHSRFQEFEAKICRNVLAKIPLCFVLNKADTATAEQLRTIRSFIEEQGLENCKGIFEVVSDRKNYSPEYCPHCKGDNFRFKQRTKELICDNPNCNRTTTIGPTSGLESLVKETIQQLPELARHSFVEAQQVTEKERILIGKCSSRPLLLVS